MYITASLQLIAKRFFMFNKNIFSARLKQLRISRNLKQEDIGQLLSVTKTQISDMETGRETTTLDNLVKLAEFYNVTTDYILGLTDKQ